MPRATQERALELVEQRTQDVFPLGLGVQGFRGLGLQGFRGLGFGGLGV